jgi:hypothetical protein
VWRISITGDISSVTCSANGKKYNFSPPQPVGTSCWVDRPCALDLIRGGVAIRSHEPRRAKRLFNAAEKVLKKNLLALSKGSVQGAD